MAVHRQSTVLFDPDEVLGVAIGAPNDPQQRHVGLVSRNVGARRFRPEEVAAGVISKNIPLDFSVADALAQDILHDLYSDCAVR